VVGVVGVVDVVDRRVVERAVVDENGKTPSHSWRAS
jgi:hypothetical protein